MPKFLDDIMTVKGKVEELLKRFPETRNNDFYLQLLYAKYVLNLPIPYIEWDQIKNIGGELETVSRCRRKYNEMGLYLPTDSEVLQQRKKREHKFRKVMPTLNISTLTNLSNLESTTHG